MALIGLERKLSFQRERFFIYCGYGVKIEGHVYGHALNQEFYGMKDKKEIFCGGLHVGQQQPRGKTFPLAGKNAGPCMQVDLSTNGWPWETVIVEKRPEPSSSKWHIRKASH